jgi:hypothetical protein
VTTPAPLDANSHTVEIRRVSTLGAGVGSALLPGVGQLLQHRYPTAVLHLASVAGYVVCALNFGGRGWLLGAAVFNLWSIGDAVWWSRASGTGQDHNTR